MGVKEPFREYGERVSPERRVEDVDDETQVDEAEDEPEQAEDEPERHHSL